MTSLNLLLVNVASADESGSEIVLEPAPEVIVNIEEESKTEEIVAEDSEEEVIIEPVNENELLEPVAEETEAPTLDEQPADGAITPEAATIEVVEDDAVTVEEQDVPAEETKKETWAIDGDKATTNDSVEKDVTYVAPQNDQVTVTFTKLPENSGTLSIEEIILTDEQIATLGAIFNKAYDITSNMTDGTFEYDLTLPKPKNQKTCKLNLPKMWPDLKKQKL